MDSVLSIEQVFNERILRVPDYQRGYAWGETQWDEFLEDVDLLSQGKVHYTGTLVLHGNGANQEVDDEGKRYAVVDVVDGQQRLTTVVLLIDAIRRVLVSTGSGEKLADGLRKRYVCATAPNNQPLYKLTLGRDSQAFFERNVLADTPAPDGPTIVAHSHLRDASRHFSNYFAGKRAEHGDAFDEWLRAFVEKVTHRLKLSVYEVSDALEVGVVFEVMNNRGKPLVELEKVKNYLLYAASKLDVSAEVLRNEVNQSWAQIFQNLMAAGITKSTEEDQLLRMHWFMAYDHDSRRWDGSKSVKKRFDLRQYAGKHPELLNDLLSYVRGLRDSSVAFCDIRNPTHPMAFRGFESNAKERKLAVDAADRMQRVGVTAVFLPLLMATRMRYPHDADKCREALDLCELFAFRVYRLMGARSNAGRNKLHALGHGLYTQRLSFDEVTVAIRRHILEYSPPSKFVAEFAPDPEKPWYRKHGLKYVLYEYEIHLAGKDEVRVPWWVVEGASLEDSVEHILPQTPTDPYWEAQFSAEERAAWTHDIGNLCLTYHNSSYKNFAFPKKKGVPGQEKPCYSSSNLYMERRLAQYDDWNLENLSSRRAEMVEWATRRWHVEPPPEGEDSGSAGADNDDDADEAD